MTDIRIPTREEIKARKARLWDRPYRRPEPPKVDATELYCMAFSSDPEEVIVMPAARTTDLLRRVAEEHGVSIADLKSFTRISRIARARQHACYALATERPDLSWPDIGRILRKDHATVWYGAKVHAERHGLPPIDRSDLSSQAKNRSPSPNTKAA